MSRAAALTVRALAASALFGAPAVAHEFWVQPDAYRVAPGSLMSVSLYHGERFAGDVVPRDERMIGRFDLVMLDQGGLVGDAVELAGMDRHERSYLRPSAAGRGVLVYESREYVNVLPPDRFEAYLQEEGLGQISTWRAERGESGLYGREAYVRCAKALVEVGEGGAPLGDVPVGLPCEIVLVTGQDGGTASEGEAGAVTVQVLFEGEPLAGARVVGVAQGDHENLIELTTDDEGLATLTPEVEGAWMFTTLHMARAEGREDVDWMSYWASLTFEIGG